MDTRQPLGRADTAKVAIPFLEWYEAKSTSEGHPNARALILSQSLFGASCGDQEEVRNTSPLPSLLRSDSTLTLLLRVAVLTARIH